MTRLTESQMRRLESMGLKTMGGGPPGEREFWALMEIVDEMSGAMGRQCDRLRNLERDRDAAKARCRRLDAAVTVLVAVLALSLPTQAAYWILWWVSP